MLIWAPEFPLWLDKPGFWDHACYLDYKVAPLFTLAILDEKGRELEPQFTDRFWQPDHTSNLYRIKSRDIVMVERRALLPWDTLVSSFEFANRLKTEQTLNLVLWSAQDTEGAVRSSSLSEIEGMRVREKDGVLIWRRRVRDPEGDQPTIENPNAGVMMRFSTALGASLKADGYAIVLSDRQPNFPRFKYSPFYEFMGHYGNLGNRQPGEIKSNPNGLLYYGLHYKLTIPADGKVTFSAYAAVAKDDDTALLGISASRKNDLFFKVPDNLPDPAPDAQNLGTAPDKLSRAVNAEPVKRPSERERRATYPAKRTWSDYFENVPDFTCSDPYIQKYYWYRWYGLRLNTIMAKDERLGLLHPCVFEGINLGWFRQHITYSAQCHMFETRWMHQPDVAQGSLLNFIHNQQPNGAFPGVIKNIYQGNRELTSNVAFYHANWGAAVREVHRIHPDKSFLEKIYEPLVKYQQYFDRERDPNGTGLYDVINHWETGQEFMSRYQIGDEKADAGGYFRMKGLDATVYIQQLLENLAWMAEQLGKTDDVAIWRNSAEKTKQAILRHMWSPDEQFFFDVSQNLEQRSKAKTTIGLYPFLAGIGGREYNGAFYRHLFNEKEFWTTFPAPSTSIDDPTFNPEGEWNERRLVCPWNGRTWLMTNSHVAEALGKTALNVDPNLIPWAVDFIRRFIKMMFLNGDVEHPSSYEYYNPYTGQAPFFRGTEDYMHSWVVDLIIKYVAGLQPEDNGKILIRPLPFDLDYFTLDRVKIAGHWLKIVWRKQKQKEEDLSGLAVWVDGKLANHTPGFAQLEIHL